MPRRSNFANSLAKLQKKRKRKDEKGKFFTPWSLNNVKTSQFSIINSQFSIKKLYLCSRFPRNRWQEVTRDLLCCAWNDNNNIINY
jgi:hypothetical protein